MKVILTVLFIAFGTVAMAKNGGGGILGSLPRVDGSPREENAAPSKAEFAQQMWRQYMGDEPMPDHLKKKYGITDDKAK